MPARIVLICGVLVLSLPLVLSGAARADGCYVPEKAIQQLPAIPTQRALVAFRDGKETLIVESELQGQGRRFGWIVPVPARPDSIEAATPGTLKSLAMGIQPEIVHDLSKQASTACWLCALVLAFVFMVCRAKRSGHGVKAILAAGVLILLLAAVAFPSLLAARRGGLPAGQVSVLDRGQVGSYEIAVLAADDAAALYAWLDGEGLAIPQALRPVVDDYAWSGWKFVVAKLMTDAGWNALPHPLRISFRTDRAVYPMRLTGLSGANLALELYVVGEEAASAAGMKRVFCDRLAKKEGWDDYRDPVRRAVRPIRAGSYGEIFLGAASRLSLGHPGLVPVLWDGCWISKLTGEIPASAMSEDFYISWQKPEPEREKFYSHKGAGYVGLMAGAAILALAGALTCGLWGLRRIGSRMLPVGLLASLGAATIAFWTLHVFLPQVEVSTYQGKGRALYRLEGELFGLQSSVHEGAMSPGDAEKRIRWLLAGQRNPYTGEPIIEDDSPGNYTIASTSRLVARRLPATVRSAPKIDSGDFRSPELRQLLNQVIELEARNAPPPAEPTEGERAEERTVTVQVETLAFSMYDLGGAPVTVELEGKP